MTEAEKKQEALKVGDAVRERDADEIAGQVIASPMVIASFKEDAQGVKDAIAVCTRQGKPAGEFPVARLRKVAEPPSVPPPSAPA